MQSTTITPTTRLVLEALYSLLLLAIEGFGNDPVLGDTPRILRSAAVQVAHILDKECPFPTRKDRRQARDIAVQ